MGLCQITGITGPGWPRVTVVPHGKARPCHLAAQPIVPVFRGFRVTLNNLLSGFKLASLALLSAKYRPSFLPSIKSLKFRKMIYE